MAVQRSGGLLDKPMRLFEDNPVYFFLIAGLGVSKSGILVGDGDGYRF